VYSNSIGKLKSFSPKRIYVNKRGFVWVRNFEKYSNCLSLLWFFMLWRKA